MRSGPRHRRLARTVAYVPWLALALVPIICGIGAIRGWWTPVSDWAVLASHTMDPPLVGMPSSISVHTGIVTRHPGPLLFWVLWGPTRLFGAPGYGMVVGTVLVNVISLGAILWLVRRTRDRALVMAMAFFLAVLFHAVGGASLRDSMNTNIVVLPMVVMLIAAWRVVAGDLWALPVFIVAGSLPAQAHVTNAPLFAALTLTVFAAVAIDLRHDDGTGRRRLFARRIAPLTILLIVVGWSAPVWDQFRGSGNLLRMVESTDDATLGARSGLGYGLSVMARMIVPVPGWLSGNTPGPIDAAGTLRFVAAGAVLISLVALTVWASRRGRRDVRAMGVIALAGCFAGVTTSMLVPTDIFSTISPANRVFWWPVAMFVWFTIAWGTVQYVDERRAVARSRPGAEQPDPVARPAVRAVPLATALAAVAVVTLSLLAVRVTSPRHDAGSSFYAPTRQISDAIRAVPGTNGPVRLELDHTDLATLFVFQGVVAQLRLSGIEVGVPLDTPDPHLLLDSMKSSYPVTGGTQVTVMIRSGTDQTPPAGYRKLTVYDPERSPKQFRGYDNSVFISGTQPFVAFIRK